MASLNAGHSFLLLGLLLCCSAVSGELSENYYANACPKLNLTSVVNSVLRPKIDADRRMGASLLRLFFHDCFPQGCDASVLLVNDTGIDSEQNAGPNKGSLRGFDVIRDIKKAVEANCNRTVSCADILAVTAREAVNYLGGPRWTVRLGRRDSLNASRDKADSDLPSPSFNLQKLKDAFKNKGFSSSEMVALSGGHSIGSVLCDFVADPVRKAECMVKRRREPLDTTSGAFDNRYYQDLLKGNGVLGSDKALKDTGDQAVDQKVQAYNTSATAFFDDFANAMSRMSEMSVLTGTQGQIRLDCERVNKK